MGSFLAKMSGQQYRLDWQGKKLARIAGLNKLVQKCTYKANKKNVNMAKGFHPSWDQCDQIWRFIGHWATF